MGVPREVVGQLGDRFAALLPHLNERQRRLALAVEARLLGHGGVGTVARVARVSETTVRRGPRSTCWYCRGLSSGYRVRRPAGMLEDHSIAVRILERFAVPVPVWADRDKAPSS